MELEEAQVLLRRGVPFSEVIKQINKNYIDLLKEYFCQTPGLPNLTARASRTTFINDKPCLKCGSQEFIPGACPTCANCGESPGGCG